MTYHKEDGLPHCSSSLEIHGQDSKRGHAFEPLKKPRRPGIGSRSSSAISIAQINDVVSDDKIVTHTYNVSELRDGFFDAIFLEPEPSTPQGVCSEGRDTLPAAFDKGDPLTLGAIIPQQLGNLKKLFIKVTTSRDGIRLIKAFLAVFIAYILCLITVIRDWLGRYSYVMVISAIINHPARAVGSQLDGTILTCVGTAAGLGWGAVGLLLSTSTLSASAGYGGILALFLVLFMAIIGWIRAFFIRFYQGVLCAGIAITFTTLADTSRQGVEWSKLKSFAVPWLLGQAISLVVCLAVYPDTGSRQLAVNLRAAFDVMQDAVKTPRPRHPRLRRRLGQAFVDLSTAYRDMRIDFTITRFKPDHIRELRNLMQATIRALLSMQSETDLFGKCETEPRIPQAFQSSSPEKTSLETDLGRAITELLAAPTEKLRDCMREGLGRCDAALMDISGYRGQLGPPRGESSDVAPLIIRTQKARSDFDHVESAIISTGKFPASMLQDAGVVRLFASARHVREAASIVEGLMEKVSVIQTASDRPRLYFPSYPFWKAIHRTNAQVRHDRGGIVAGSYRTTFGEISQMLDKLKARAHNPTGPEGDDLEEESPNENVEKSHATMDASADAANGAERAKIGFRIWKVLHRLQGLESTYALKVCIVTSLLSVPSYLDYTQGWWDRYEAWWAVSMAWIMMHSTVGGNVHDMITRAFFAAVGALWGGLAYAAGGNDVVLGVFAGIFYMPMMYRFTQSSHSRSGLVGLVSFTVISLGFRFEIETPPALFCVFKGLAFFVGVIAPVIVNWALWPFIARHELRAALSSMLFFMSIIYRNVLGKYIYFREGQAPTSEDVRRSEILEGRLREGFVRVQQLLVMTRHEIRLRGPLDPVPYSALADAAERFFDYLVAVRQSALFYNPTSIRDNPLGAQKLLSHRRDAVAAVMANLYILSGALKSQRPVPRYLPSAAAARKTLLLKTAEVEEELARNEKDVADDNVNIQGHTAMSSWTGIYSYSYNESLTGCVATLEELEKYTKLIVGEQMISEFEGEEEQLLQ